MYPPSERSRSSISSSFGNSCSPICLATAAFQFLFFWKQLLLCLSPFCLPTRFITLVNGFFDCETELRGCRKERGRDRRDRERRARAASYTQQSEKRRQHGRRSDGDDARGPPGRGVGESRERKDSSPRSGVSRGLGRVVARRDVRSRASQSARLFSLSLAPAIRPSVTLLLAPVRHTSFHAN